MTGPSANPAPPFGFRCSTCGQWHDGPSLDVGFSEPLYVHELSPDDRAAQVTGTGDFRVWNSNQGTHYFVRGVIEIPVHGIDDGFCYGVWASLSADSYARATAAYDANEAAGPLFGWLSNRLPGYPETLHLKTNVSVRPDQKPSIVLHRADHPLVREQREGMSLRRVQQLVEAVIHPRTIN
jgi:hypothetical protein